ncbi:hypothetical protein [Agromyces italicus]|uniref:hypothetical protein n=1 Tax=Agromyces italicus TaxID=279572 RepID=UPI0012FA1593|nr:hypothetical protein [Agromyces italicus]
MFSLTPAMMASAATGVNNESREMNLALAEGMGQASATTSSPITPPDAEADLVAAALELPGELPDPAAENVPVSDGQSDPVTVKVGGMDVSAAPSGSAGAPAEIEVRVADAAEAEDAGITTGVLLEVSDTSTVPASTEQAVELTLSFETFAGLGGGDWASRIQPLWIPDCAADASTNPDCAPVELTHEVDFAAQTVTVEVPVTAAEAVTVPEVPQSPDSSAGPDATEPPAPTETPNAPEPSESPAPTEPAPEETPEASGGAAPAMFRATTLTSTASSGGRVGLSSKVAGAQGDWSATGLSASSTWGTSGATGAFTWSYPMRTPNVPAGPVPEVGLSYSSAVSDGRVPSTNNQSGPVGEGFDIGASFIERTYTRCDQDETGAANNSGFSAPDLCWGKQNASLSLNGSGSELIPDDTVAGLWHSRRDDGTRIQHLGEVGTAGEHWKVTTTDGTQYFFGKNTNAGSAWTVPVFGNHPGEKCHAAEFTDSRCSQTWRWMLDQVIDPSGNEASYTYAVQKNYYRPFYGDGKNVEYTAGGNLTRIDYGKNAATSTPLARVEFTNLPRCITDLAKPSSWCSGAQTSTRANHWPDTPVDLICTSTSECTTYAPTFFSRTRLAKVSTYAYEGSAYQPVDSWALQEAFVPQGSGIGLEYARGVMLRLESVKHNTDRAGVPAVDIPPAKFEYQELRNRVGKDEHDSNALYRHRLQRIRTEAGGYVSVVYGTGCEAVTSEEPALCFPMRWRGSGDGSDYFYKYVVTQVTEGHTTRDASSTELVTGSSAKITHYTYSGYTWVKPSSPLIPDAEMNRPRFDAASF